jgi:hypothetical protein
MTISLDSRRTAKPCQFRTPPRSSSPRCAVVLVTNFSHSSLRVFRHLHTLSFFESQLSRVLSAACALFCKKPGVHPFAVEPLFSIPRRACPPELQRRRTILFISLAYENKPRISFISPTYEKTGGVYPTQKCRRADIRDFSPDISHFLALSVCKGACPSPPKLQRRRTTFPRLFLSPPKFAPKPPRISRYTALTGPLSP